MAEETGGASNHADATAHTHTITEYTGPSLWHAYDRFEEFHKANPHVYQTLVWLAREWVHRTDRTKVGIAALWERMRWELAIQTTTKTPRLNNNYKAYYARLIMQTEPDLEGLFDVRRSAADQVLDVAA